MQQFNIDTIGQLPEAKYGYKYIVVMIDTFTRYIELFPMRDLTKEEAATALIQHIGRWGCPSILMSDGGTQFKNSLFMEILNYLHVADNISIPYSKEENRVVER